MASRPGRPRRLTVAPASLGSHPGLLADVAGALSVEDLRGAIVVEVYAPDALGLLADLARAFFAGLEQTLRRALARD